MCYLCLWNSRADEKHYVKSVWPPKPNDSPSRFNCVQRQLVYSQNVSPQTLHLKLSLVKNIIKTMKWANHGFQCLTTKFKDVTGAKFELGVFNGNKVRSLIDDGEFLEAPNQTEKNVRLAFFDIALRFLGNHRQLQRHRAPDAANLPNSWSQDATESTLLPPAHGLLFIRPWSC